MSDSQYDVVIVGAGIAGNIVARELGQAGKKVLILESGPTRPPTERQEYLETFYLNSDKVPESPYPPDIDSNPGTEAVPRPTTNATFPSSLSPGYPDNLANGGFIFDPDISYLLQKGPLPFLSTSERVAGGTTWHWLGTSLRFLENDFQMQTQYGVEKNWPLTVDELTDDYGRAESEVGVAADTATQEKYLGPVGVRYAPGYEYPMQPLLDSLVDQAVASAVDGQAFPGFDNLSAEVTQTPAGRNSQPFEQRRTCAGNTNCIPICPIQAKYDATVTLSEALQTGNVEVKYQTVVNKVNVDQNGRVSSVDYITWTQDGSGNKIRTGTGTATGTVFVIAAHAVETPRLLLMSADESRGSLKNGVANSSGLVGANLMDHPLYLTWALTPNPVWGFRGPLSTSGIETLRDGPFRNERAAWRVEIGNEGWNFSATDPWTSTIDMIDGTNVGQLNPNGRKLFGDELVAKLNHDFIRQWRMAFLVEQTPESTNRITLDPSLTDGLGLPRPVVSYDLSEYTKLGFVHAEIFARYVYQAMGARSYVQNPAEVTNNAGQSVPNPSYFPMQPEWNHYFEALPPELKTKELTNLDNPNGIPDGFQYFGAGHIVGTCAMGSSGSSSVVNADLRTWDHDNLYILGCTVFPTITTANPTLTIAALSFRAARAIQSALGS